MQYQNTPQGALCVHMQTTSFGDAFDLKGIIHPNGPLPVEEMQKIMDELNTAMKAACPLYLKLLPLIIGVLTIGCCPVGAVITLFLLLKVNPKSLLALRSKLSELNVRYQESGVDFDLHSASHLRLYMSEGHLHTAKHTDYTLVVQNTRVVGNNRIPSSNVLADQAMRGFGGGMDMEQPPMQQGMQKPMQQPLIMAQPMGGGAQQSQSMSVTCPEGAMPGTSIQIQAPDGRMVAVQVPAGVVPGALFQVQL